MDPDSLQKRMSDIQNSEEAIQEMFGRLVSGKKGYKAVIETKKIPPKCVRCGRGGDENQKFCPQCGGEMKVPLTKCPGCKNSLSGGEKFCTGCGKSLEGL